MTALLTALSSGLSAKKILDYLIRKSPELAPKIKTALAAGLSAEKVVKFFSNDKNEEKLKKTMEKQYSMNFNANPAVQAETIRKQNLAPDLASGLQRAVPPVLGTAAALGTSYALSRALPPIVSGLATNQTTPPGTQIQTPSSQPTQTQIPPINTNVTPTISQPPPINQQEILNKIKELSSIGKSPGDIVELFTQKAPEEISKVEKETGKKFIDFIQESLVDPAELARRKALETFKGKERERVETAYPELQKQSVVATPQGVGEIKEIRGDKALVEIDGKISKVDADELIQSPLPEKDLADLHDDLIKGIEKHTEEEVSRMVNFSGYDEGTNSLAFLPYDGALYIYDNLSDEEKAIAMNLMAKRKTSGENHIGAWVEGTKSPAGAAMSAFIKQLQATRGGKGNEYQRKYQTVYSAFEPAIKASKEKKKKKKKKS